MADLGGAGPVARAAIADFERAVAAPPAESPGPPPRVIFVLGAARPTAAGPGTFVGDLIEHCGGVNAGRDVAGPLSWRPTDVESIARAAPDVLICQVDESESAEAARAWWLARTMIPAARSGRVVVVDEPEWTIPSHRSIHSADGGPDSRGMIIIRKGSATHGRRSAWGALSALRVEPDEVNGPGKPGP
jgi:ABC-type Fe3+-hydroxamate transport system substrate-binding protein